MDVDDKSSSVSGWATPKRVGSTGDQDKRTGREKPWWRLTNEANRHRLHRGDERSRDSEKLRENGRQCRRGPG